MEKWIKGTITVENGVVVAMDSEIAGEPATILGGTLATTMSDVENHGWQVDGELPPYTTQTRYVVNLKKRHDLAR